MVQRAKFWAAALSEAFLEPCGKRDRDFSLPFGDTTRLGEGAPISCYKDSELRVGKDVI